MKNQCLLVIVCVVFLLSFSVEAKTLQGHVTGVTDGDTIKIKSNGKQVKIRLYGIDTPEKGQAFGQAAKRQISAILTPRVTVEEMDIDRYGRTVGVVYDSTGKNINQEMVRQGYAWVYQKYCRSSFCSTWLSMESAAQKSRIGLWAEQAMPPWEWRKMKRQKK